jgi:hypothetical protein
MTVQKVSLAVKRLLIRLLFLLPLLAAIDLLLLGPTMYHRMMIVRLRPKPTINVDLLQASRFFYNPALSVEQREVRWLDPDIVGPYNGKHDLLPKCDFTLTENSARSFFLLYNCLRNQFSANLFHPELLPDLAYISPTLDLTTTPVDARSLPPVGK